MTHTLLQIFGPPAVGKKTFLSALGGESISATTSLVTLHDIRSDSDLVYRFEIASAVNPNAAAQVYLFSDSESFQKLQVRGECPVRMLLANPKNGHNEV